MALFQPRVFQQIFAGMVGRMISSTPLTDLNIGSVFTTMLEAAAQEDDEQYFQMLEIIRGYSLDTVSGTDLDARAYEYSLVRNPAAFASTNVSLIDTSITKISTNCYSGLPGSGAGTFVINGNALTGFPASGKIVIGRGTPRAETISYSSITQQTNYVTFNLTGGLAHDHGTDETIILSQGGNRSVNAGIIVVVPASDINPKIAYRLTAAASILDGERQVDLVPIVAVVAGSDANVPIGSITAFSSLPFATAVVFNPARVTNGKDAESDQDLRDRIKKTIQSLSRGTGQAIITNVTGVLSTTDNKRVVSASLVEPTIPADVVKLFIDDGTGFIPSFADVGYEVVVAQAQGGEKFLFAQNVPMVKAFVETQNAQPYNLIGGETLFVSVGGVVETIQFLSSDFALPGRATAQEVLTKINAIANTFEARVTQAGATLRIFSRSNVNEQIQVTGGTANAILGFQTDAKFTAFLYKVTNYKAKLLTKDGVTATLQSTKSAAYSFPTMKNLVLVVDGAVEDPQMMWFKPGDFPSPTSVTAPMAVALINQRLAGVIAQTVSNGLQVGLTSKTPLSTGSQLEVVETFTTAFNFSGSFSDITAAIKSAGGAQISHNTSDVLYVGHATVAFQSLYVSHFTSGGGSAPIYQYWNGSNWINFTPFDLTGGLAQVGHLLFRLPGDQLPNIVNGVAAYWIRISNISNTTLAMKICSANEAFGFPETLIVGANKDYTLNRFLGQIELEATLNALESVTLGSLDTRASVVSVAGNYGLVGGEQLMILVDGVAMTSTIQISDLSNPGSALPSEVVARLNKDFSGATASLVAAGTQIKLQSNTWSGGTLQIVGGSMNTYLQFPTDLETSYDPHSPALESVAGPFAFDPGDNIIAVLDKNSANNFTTPCTSPGTLTAVSSSTSMTDSNLYNIFPNANDVSGFDFIYTQTYYKTIQAIRYSSSNALKQLVNVAYTAGATPGAEAIVVTAQNIVIQIASGVTTANQIIALFNGSTAARNLAAVSLAGSGTAAQVAVAQTFLNPVRAQISSYTVPSGMLTLASGLPVTPAIGDSYEIAPRTAAQVVAFWSNKRIALITTVAEVRTSSGGTKVQIASLASGEAASVQIPGGEGNTKLQYPTLVLIGTDGYRHYTGLAQLAQWTVDGRSSDLTNYPGFRAAGVQVEVAEAVKVPITVSMTITTQEGITLSAISNEIKSAVSSYINSLPVGGEVVVSSIVAVVKAVNGVFDVVVNSPTSNVSISYNELARVVESTIIVG
jgi:uncharacterized phage protein gp47/JayE